MFGEFVILPKIGSMLEKQFANAYQKTTC